MQLVRLLTLCAIGAVLGNSAAAASELAWTCKPSAKQFCEADGCRQIEATTWNIVSLDEKKLSRCDEKGCDVYEAEFSFSGVFITVEVPGRGLLLRTSLDGSAFLEVVTLGTSAYLSFGECER